METRSSNGGRIPPQDLEAEKSLLGAVLLSDEAFPEISERLKPRDFYEERHAHIYQAMINLYNTNRPIDLLTLTAELKSNKTLKSIGGAPYLAELTKFVPTASHATAYAEIIAEAATRRRLIKAGAIITEKAYDAGNQIGELLGQAEKELFDVTDQTTKTEYSSLEELAPEAFDRIEELHKNRDSLRGLKTGFKDLDKVTAGFQKGDLIILGARPSMGKTTFAQNLAYNIASFNKRGILFFSMEMSKDQIVDHIIADIAGVDSFKIRTGNLSDDDFSKIGDAIGEMSELPIYIDDSSFMNILELRNKARRAAHDHDIGIIILDYLQLLSGTDRYAGNRVQEVAEISRGLKSLARELEIPVIALAQLSRNVTGRDDPRPVLSDLRDSGSIEQDADLVMFIHRPDYYHKNEDDYEETNITELLINKHRNGPLAKIELYFHKEFSRFMSLDKKHE